MRIRIIFGEDDRLTVHLTFGPFEVLQMASMLARYNTVKEMAPTIDPASRPEVYIGVDVPAKEGGRVMMAERCGHVCAFVWCIPGRATLRHVQPIAQRNGMSNPDSRPESRPIQS